MRKFFRDPALRFLLTVEGGGSPGGGGGAPGGGSGPGSGPGGGTGSGDPWYQPHVGSLDKDTLAYLDGKKFPTMLDALKSGAASDKMARERNVIARPDPAKMGEWEGWGALGWDADRTKYAGGIKPPKMPNNAAHDAALFDDAVAIGHELKIPPSQVEGFVQKLSDKVNARLQDLANQGRTATEQMETDLRKAWGADYDVKSELGKRAAKALGIGVDDLSELEKVTGSVRLRKMFADIGTKLGEANLVSGGTGGGTAGLTPAAADAELRRLEGDKEFMAAYKSNRNPGHKDAQEKWMKLLEIAAKGGNTQAARR